MHCPFLELLASGTLGSAFKVLKSLWTRHGIQNVQPLFSIVDFSSRLLQPLAEAVSTGWHLAFPSRPPCPLVGAQFHSQSSVIATDILGSECMNRVSSINGGGTVRVSETPNTKHSHKHRPQNAHRHPEVRRTRARSYGLAQHQTIKPSNSYFCLARKLLPAET